ncbi:MAG: hypothetical protein M3Y82_08310 [Verrucomicrobiota bacterium]|nr:hypothetical protein [Verrucomicrobiota bacterium]
MNAHTNSENAAPLDLSRWRNLPNILIAVGGILAVLGAFLDLRQFGYSWLVAFMFFLSLAMGGFFLVMIHHLVDASWSVPIRRVCEHLACLSFPTLLLLFIPIAILAPGFAGHPALYPWMDSNPAHDHALKAKFPLFTKPMFYIVAAICFAVWGFFSNRLRFWSLQQDQTGAAECTYKMRFYSSLGIVLFALTLTLACIMWMKALMHEWFSTMYGVYYFAGSVWMTLATVYAMTVILKRTGHLRKVAHEKQFYFIGTLLFAFTVFYAYVTFSQYFIIWNANMPEETFWYVLREKGTWWDVGMVIIFGHFFAPFLMLLRIDFKLKLAVMLSLAIWAWLMHYTDMQFNIGPVLHPNGFVLHWMDIACMAFMAGVVAKVFLKNFNSHPPYPQKDPRMAEGQDIYVPETPGLAIAPERAQ